MTRVETIDSIKEKLIQENIISFEEEEVVEGYRVIYFYFNDRYAGMIPCELPEHTRELMKTNFIFSLIAFCGKTINFHTEEEIIEKIKSL